METQENRRPALPLLALLALASALGVAVAIALAAVTMLLAAPAYAAEGTLLLERRSGHARIVEAYRNPFAETLAGVYLRRLPSDAVLESLSFAPGDGEARPALLTLRQGAALVERTVAIGPGETLRVELEYRSRPPRRLLTRCCSPSSAARASALSP